jgi:hypothetical protein
MGISHLELIELIHDGDGISALLVHSHVISHCTSATPRQKVGVIILLNALSGITPKMSKAPFKAVIHKPPVRPQVNGPSVVLYGGIQPEPAWQTSLAASLSDLPVDILDPRRDDWDSSWIEDVSFPKFKEQVDWEMDYAKVADVIVFYFPPELLTPVALLELGMHAGTGKALVCCPEGFHKRGNVQIVCLRYGIDLVDTLDDLKDKVRTRLMEKLQK